MGDDLHSQSLTGAKHPKLNINATKNSTKNLNDYSRKLQTTN